MNNIMLSNSRHIRAWKLKIAVGWILEDVLQESFQHLPAIKAASSTHPWDMPDRTNSDESAWTIHVANSHLWYHYLPTLHQWSSHFVRARCRCTIMWVELRVKITSAFWTSFACGDLDLDASNVRCTMMYLICSVILQSSYRSNISLAPEDLGHFFGLGLIGCCDSPGVGKHKKMSLALLQNGLPPIIPFQWIINMFPHFGHERRPTLARSVLDSQADTPLCQLKLPRLFRSPGGTWHWSPGPWKHPWNLLSQPKVANWGQKELPNIAATAKY